MGLLQRVSLGRSSGEADLKVGRLRMVAMTAEMLVEDVALGKDSERLGSLLAAKIPAAWPPVDWEPHVLEFILKQYEEHPDTTGWHRFVVLSEGLGASRASRTLVGCVGAFPKGGGDAEMGYSTLPMFQRRGFATAAAKTLMEWLLTREGVASVSACTYPRLPESIKVMERCGMTYAGDGDEPGTVKYQRVRKSSRASKESSGLRPGKP